MALLGNTRGILFNFLNWILLIKLGSLFKELLVLLFELLLTENFVFQFTFANNLKLFFKVSGWREIGLLFNNGLFDLFFFLGSFTPNFRPDLSRKGLSALGGFIWCW
jgi:hypothetical protein